MAVGGRVCPTAAGAYSISSVSSTCAHTRKNNIVVGSDCKLLVNKERLKDEKRICTRPDQNGVNRMERKKTAKETKNQYNL